KITPDVMTLAKALSGGVACGAMLARPEIGRSLKPGMHAATFGGNPIACAAGIATIETIEADDLLAGARRIEESFSKFFTDLQKRSTVIKEVRAVGAMIGVELNVPVAPFVE